MDSKGTIKSMCFIMYRYYGYCIPIHIEKICFHIEIDNILFQGISNYIRISSYFHSPQTNGPKQRQAGETHLCPMSLPKYHVRLQKEQTLR